MPPLKGAKNFSKGVGGGNAYVWRGYLLGAVVMGAVAAYFALSGAGESAAAASDGGESVGEAAAAAEDPVILSVADGLAQLNTEVFSSSGGDAWLVWCSDSTAAAPDGAAPQAIIAELAPQLAGIARVSKGLVRFVALHCRSSAPC
jgi:hypothetical protein